MSKPLVSVIIPTYNSEKFLEGCLESIKKQIYPHIELIVVDNNSKDTTKEIAKKYTEKVFNQGPERSAQRNFGVKQSKGEYVVIIDSDMHLSEKVIEACIEKMQENPHIKGLVIPEESFGEGFWAQCKKLERSFYVGIEWMEAGRFFERKTFEEMNGYDEENTGTEDYDLPQRIKEKYGKESIGSIQEFILHNEMKISLVKTCKKKFYYAQKLDAYQSQKANIENFSKQSNPLERYKLFFSKPKKLFEDPILGLGMLFMKTCEFGFGGMGYVLRKMKGDSRKNIYG